MEPVGVSTSIFSILPTCESMHIEAKHILFFPYFSTLDSFNVYFPGLRSPHAESEWYGVSINPWPATPIGPIYGVEAYHRQGTTRNRVT